MAQLHSLNWYKPLHPNIPLDSKPEGYILFFNLNQSILNKFATREEIPEIGKVWKDKVPYLTEPLVQESLLTCADNIQKLKKYSTNDILPSGDLFRHHTFLHGDYHHANIFFIPETSKEDGNLTKDMVIVDWQLYGYGHPSTEFCYFLENSVVFDPEQDIMLMKLYYEELTKTVPPEEYPWWVFQREVEFRSINYIILGFSLFKNSPENFKKMSSDMEKKGMDMDLMLKNSRDKYMRFAHIVQKWNQEKIFVSL
jgi:hypothetical protein